MATGRNVLLLILILTINISCALVRIIPGNDKKNVLCIDRLFKSLVVLNII